MTDKPQFTEKQEKFIDALLDEAKGNTTEAKKIAGYSMTTGLKEILTDAVVAEITKRAGQYIAIHGPKAVVHMLDVMENPEMPGSDRKLAAAKEILDRGGLGKLERVQVTSDKPIGLLILPPKDQG